MAGRARWVQRGERAVEQTFEEIGVRPPLPARFGRFDQDLVVYGDFMTHAAVVAMDELLARRSDFDVVVAANDAMALGVISSLRKHGRKVPENCAVTGFDDLIQARLGSPTVTTVSQPLELLAQSALDSVAAQLAHQEVPAVTQFAGEFFARNSCGCGARSTTCTWG